MYQQKLLQEKHLKQKQPVFTAAETTATTAPGDTEQLGQLHSHNQQNPQPQQEMGYISHRHQVQRQQLEDKQLDQQHQQHIYQQ